MRLTLQKIATVIWGRNPSPTIFLSVFTPKFSNWSDRYRIRPLQKFGSHSEFAEQNNYKLRITNYALINRISS